MTTMKRCGAMYDPDGAQVSCARRTGHDGNHRSTPGDWEDMGEPVKDLDGHRLEWEPGGRNPVWVAPKVKNKSSDSSKGAK